MKILYVNTAMATWGGIERVLVEKMNYLSEQYGYEICLVTADQGNHPIHYPLNRNIVYQDLGINFHQQYHFKGIRRIIKELKLNRLFVERLRCLILESPPDIIVSIRSNLTNNIVKAKGNIPLVFESHSLCLASRFEGDGLLRRIHIRYLQLVVRKAAMTVALTQGDADEWRKLTPKVCVIPNVVHLNDSGMYSDCTAKSVIFVGRFSKQKNVGSLLRIWTLVHERYPDWSLHFYGGYGEEQDSVLAKIKQMDAHVQVHEATSHMMEKYRESSILLMTSSYEPFGLVLPEAMSCGLPVVAFDCPYGPADIITDGTDGFLVKAGDIKAYVDRVCYLLDNVTLRQKMGRAGQQASQRFDASKVMPIWKNMFEQIMKR